MPFYRLGGQEKVLKEASPTAETQQAKGELMKIGLFAYPRGEIPRPHFQTRRPEIFLKKDLTKINQRAELQTMLAKKMYDDIRVVMIAWKNNTFAMSKRIGSWTTQYGSPRENNLDCITWSGQ